MTSMFVSFAQTSLSNATAGATITYDFANGLTISGDTSRLDSFQTADNLVGFTSVNTNNDRKFWWHDTQHGVNFYVNNTVEISVAGRAQITFYTCTYGGPNTFIEFSDASGNVLGTVRADNRGDTDGQGFTFDYTGQAGIVTATFVGDDKAIYIHGLKVENSNGLADVWDFGAEQLDANLYDNMLDVATINGWYDAAITPGSNGNTLPDFTVGAVSWVGNPASDRLRTTNTSLTRKDENIYGATDATGLVYANGTTDGSIRYFTIDAQENDEITFKARSGNSGGNLRFHLVSDPTVQDEFSENLGDIKDHTFVAKQTGTYKLYDAADKLIVYRITQKEANYKLLSGTVDVSAAGGIPSDFQIVFTNQFGEEWAVTPSGGNYSVSIPEGQNYTYSLSNAPGYQFQLAASATPSFTYDASVTGLNIAIEAVKAKVWDFGAEQFDANLFENMLDVATINAWYDAAITPGSNGNTLPDFTVGAVSWVGNPASDRLRTTNTSLTRKDENIYGATDATGLVYANGTTDGSIRYFTIDAQENDEITFKARSGNSGGNLRFHLVSDPTVQDEFSENLGDIKDHTFVAKQTGTYKLYDAADKLIVYRITQKQPIYQTLTGAVDVSLAPGIPANYGIVFTNEFGKPFTATMSGGSYSATLPSGYDYQISLENANGYVLSVTEVAVDETTKVLNLAIVKAVVYQVSGSISGLGSDISNLALTYAADPAAGKLFVPKPKINAAAGTYTVELEANVAYTITASGVNDYTLSPETITIGEAAETANLTFTEKPKYAITITSDDLDATQLGKLALTFTNVNETGYEYTFADVSTVELRDGTYTLSYSGLDEYPLEMALTSNLTVDGAAGSKNLSFNKVTNWSFDDRVIVLADTHYKGLQLTQVKNEIAKGHVGVSTAATIKVPVGVNEKMTVSYYYAANFSIDGGTAITTSSGSTSVIETAEYINTGAAATYVTLTFGGTTYITNINVDRIVPYKEVVTVGVDKDYLTINGAIEDINKMVRTETQRVTVLIDPGNYEEMVVISSPNITFKNAASMPSIALANQGVDIDDNAVRITSYYGFGYHYYSQGDDNKWNAEVLEVNKANGYRSNDNVSGTTKASYWNATVVVSSTGFTAEDIIFENSFNQYISLKESQDVVVEGNGTKGPRPTTVGDVSVQNRSFVERAAAIGIAGGADKVVLNNCRVVGRQDAFFGNRGARVAVYRGAMMGAVDYIFGGMTAVFYHTDFVLNTSDTAGDAAYITAAQQDGGRGYLMYECNVISTIPEVETASLYGAKPGYFGRPWQANTSEVVFYKTKIDTSTYPGDEGKSLISAEGWTSSLGGESAGMYEFQTVEKSGVDNTASRASWATLLTTPTLNDGTDITTFNFTKGSDDWDPFPALRAADDTDGDTIVDLDEIENGTDPSKADTDGDGKDDAEEGLTDFDGDGIIDALESSTNDEDGDGLADEKDVDNLDPLSDSDGDGYLDYDETTQNQSDANDATSVPLDTDGDGTSNLNDDDDDDDGLTDAQEALIGSNPTLVDSDGDGVNDLIDNCPTTSNADQSDLDFDGIGDVCDDLKITASQAITPNGDGINDTWLVENILNHPKSVIRVYNRWGAEVFSVVNYQNDWDGRRNTDSASRLPSGSYYYTIDLDGDGSPEDKGWIYIASN